MGRRQLMTNPAGLTCEAEYELVVEEGEEITCPDDTTVQCPGTDWICQHKVNRDDCISCFLKITVSEIYEVFHN